MSFLSGTDKRPWLLKHSTQSAGLSKLLILLVNFKRLEHRGILAALHSRASVLPLYRFRSCPPLHYARCSAQLWTIVRRRPTPKLHFVPDITFRSVAARSYRLRCRSALATSSPVLLLWPSFLRLGGCRST